MNRFVKCIGFLIVALAMWQMRGDGSVPVTTAGDPDAVVSLLPVYPPQLAVSCFFSMPLSAPNAELAENTGRIQFLNYLRVQRSSVAEYLSSLKGWVTLLSHRVASLFLHREKLFDTVPVVCGSQVCDYYVFTLRRILI